MVLQMALINIVTKRDQRLNSSLNGIDIESHLLVKELNLSLNVIDIESFSRV